MATGTPFFPRTFELNKSLSWKDWSGFFAASRYQEFHQPEYAAIRNGVALIDVSPLYKYIVEGRDAATMLDRLVTRSVRRLKVGKVIYTPWCDNDGKVLQEGTIMRLDNNRFQINAAEPAIRWLQLNSHGFSLDVQDQSKEIAALAVQGPNSRTLLDEVTDGSIEELGYFGVKTCRIGGATVTISRTGYTGDLGYELWIPAADTLVVWDRLIQAGEGYGVTPCGLLALDIARIEAGFILIDVDYVPADQAKIPSQKSSPFELGLGWTVKLGKKSHFNGLEALSCERSSSSDWQLVGLEIPWEPLEELYMAAGLMPELPATAWRDAIPVYHDGLQIGRATSGCWSTTLKKYLALASVRSHYATVGKELQMEITVDYARKQAPAQVVDLPFYRPSRMRE